MGRTRIILSTLLLAMTITFSLSSCNKDEEDGMDTAYSSLFLKTDYFIDMLDKIYDSYDAIGKKSADTSDGNYTVTPIGRMIIVKKKSYVKKTYKEIRDALDNHYKKSYKVKTVFLNNAGTVTIDCRK